MADSKLIELPVMVGSSKSEKQLISVNLIARVMENSARRELTNISLSNGDSMIVEMTYEKVREVMKGLLIA